MEARVRITTQSTSHTSSRMGGGALARGGPGRALRGRALRGRTGEGGAVFNFLHDGKWASCAKKSIRGRLQVSSQKPVKLIIATNDKRRPRTAKTPLLGDHVEFVAAGALRTSCVQHVLRGPDHAWRSCQVPRERMKGMEDEKQS